MSISDTANSSQDDTVVSRTGEEDNSHPATWLWQSGACHFPNIIARPCVTLPQIFQLCSSSTSILKWALSLSSPNPQGVNNYARKAGEVEVKWRGFTLGKAVSSSDGIRSHCVKSLAAFGVDLRFSVCSCFLLYCYLFIGVAERKDP